MKTPRAKKINSTSRHAQLRQVCRLPTSTLQPRRERPALRERFQWDFCLKYVDNVISVDVKGTSYPIVEKSSPEGITTWIEPSVFRQIIQVWIILLAPCHETTLNPCLRATLVNICANPAPRLKIDPISRFLSALWSKNTLRLDCIPSSGNQ